MGFYISLFMLTAFFSLNELFNISAKVKRNIAILLGIVYIFLSGLRWNNVDWHVYYPFFMNNYTLDDFWYGSTPIDKGFGLINFFVKSFTSEYTVLLFILAIVIISIKINFILKFSVVPLFSLFYWYGNYIGDIFFIRQSLAIAFILIAFRFIVKKNIWGFLLFTFIASTIQISTISFLLAYYVFHRKVSIKYMVIGLIISMIIGKLLDTSSLLSLGRILNVIPIDAERLSTKIDLYAYDHDYSTEGSVAILGYLRRLMFLPVELWAMNKIRKFDPNYQGCLNLVVFGYILYFLFGNMGQVFASRLNSAYVIFEIITLPAVLILFKSWKTKLVIFIVILIYVLFKYIYFIDLHYEDYVPYLNIIFND